MPVSWKQILNLQFSVFPSGQVLIRVQVVENLDFDDGLLSLFLLHFILLAS